MFFSQAAVNTAHRAIWNARKSLHDAPKRVNTQQFMSQTATRIHTERQGCDCFQHNRPMRWRRTSWGWAQQITVPVARAWMNGVCWPEKTLPKVPRRKYWMSYFTAVPGRTRGEICLPGQKLLFEFFCHFFPVYDAFDGTIFGGRQKKKPAVDWIDQKSPGGRLFRGRAAATTNQPDINSFLLFTSSLM